MNQDFSDAIAKKPAKAEAAVTIEPSKGNTKDAAKNSGKDAENVSYLYIVFLWKTLVFTF